MKSIVKNILFFISMMVAVSSVAQYDYEVPTMKEVQKGFFKKTTAQCLTPDGKVYAVPILLGTLRMNTLKVEINSFLDSCCMAVPMRELSLIKFYEEYCNQKANRIAKYYRRIYGKMAENCDPKTIVDLVSYEGSKGENEAYRRIKELVMARYTVGEHMVFDAFLYRRCLTAEIMYATMLVPTPEVVEHFKHLVDEYKSINDIPQEERIIMYDLIRIYTEMIEAEPLPKETRT